MSDPAPDFDPGSSTKSARFEIKFVLWAVLAVVVFGGLYVLIAGSPTRNRAATDSTNSPPAAMFDRQSEPAPPKHK